MERRRKGVRLIGRDYAKMAWYFVTLRMARGTEGFGDIVNGRMKLSGLGHVADACWRAVPAHMDGWELDAYVVMPDHFHGIVCATEPRGDRGSRGRATGSAAPTRTLAGGSTRATLGVVINQFKTAVSKIARDHHGIPAGMLWQRGYHERVIREGTVDRYRHYIVMNPTRWRHPRTPTVRVGAADPAALPRESAIASNPMENAI